MKFTYLYLYCTVRSRSIVQASPYRKHVTHVLDCNKNSIAQKQNMIAAKSENKNKNNLQKYCFVIGIADDESYGK